MRIEIRGQKIKCIWSVQIFARSFLSSLAFIFMNLATVLVLDWHLTGQFLVKCFAWFCMKVRNVWIIRFVCKYRICIVADVPFLKSCCNKILFEYNYPELLSPAHQSLENFLVFSAILIFSKWKKNLQKLIHWNVRFKGVYFIN